MQRPRPISANYRSPVFGVGINDSDYKTQEIVNGVNVICPYYQTWYDVMRRVYSTTFHKKQPTYERVTVCESWNRFSNFRKWMVKQDWRGKEIDKDIIKPNANLYSPATCCFVKKSLNNILTGRNRRDGGTYPTGVSYHGPRNTYVARLSMNGVRHCLGYFKTPSAAGVVYRAARAKYLRDTAAAQTDQRIARGLRKHATILLKG
jgi:hypothetical protein